MPASPPGNAGLTRKQIVSLLYFVMYCALACQGRFISVFFRDSLGLSSEEIGIVLAVGTFIGLFSTPAWSALCDYWQEQRRVLILTVSGGAVSALLYLLPLTSPTLFADESALMWTLLCRTAYCFFFSPATGILDSIAVHTLDNPKKDFGQCRLWGSLSWGLVSALVLGPLLDCCVAGWIQPVGFALFALVVVATTQTLLAGADSKASEDKGEGGYKRFEDEDAIGDVSMCVLRGSDGPVPDRREMSAAERADRLVEEIFVAQKATVHDKSPLTPAADQDPKQRAAERALELVEAKFAGFQDMAACHKGGLAEDADGKGWGRKAGAGDAGSASPPATATSGESVAASDPESAADLGVPVVEGSRRRGGGGDEEAAGGGNGSGWWGAAQGVGDVLTRTCLIVWAERWLSLVFFLMLFVMGACTSLVEGLVFLFFTKDLGASNLLCGLSVAVTVSFEIPIFHYSDRLLKVLNNHQLMTIACLAYIFRVVWYTSFANPWMVLVVEPLHGVTFACKALAAVHYAAELAPPGLETSAQGLGNTILQLGVITGSIVGGSIMDSHGSIFLYRAAAALVAATLLVYLAVTLSYTGASSLYKGREIRKPADEEESS